MTDAFLGLSPGIKGCQNEEKYEDCTSKLFMDDAITKCGCLPLGIRLSKQV